ncbi:LrgB family protein [Bradyrhizobium genosp. A]|uniref:LrgB family protein n=1 Tax=Bradyrhizobium genosp. A TaxID=83626 RepID=UPI003CF044A1
MRDESSLITFLSTSPLIWLVVTLWVWWCADRVSVSLGRSPAANPVLISVVAIVLLLEITGTPYPTYLAGVQFIQFLIGPAIVAIAIPLFRNWSTVRQNVVPILIALIAGCFTAIMSVLVLGTAFGLPRVITISLAPKSSTAGVAMAISQHLGGEATMTAAFTVTTSIIGAMTIASLARWLRVKDPAAIGLAVGLGAHSVGTARAFQIDPVAGTFAGIALCLNAILTALIMPSLVATLP